MAMKGRRKTASPHTKRAGKAATQSSLRSKAKHRKPKDPEKAESLSRRIRRAAEEIGGPSALAKKLGLQPQTVGNWIGKNPRTPGAQRLADIVRATECDAAWLLTGFGEAFPVRTTTRDDGAEVIAGAADAIQRSLDESLSALESLVETMDRRTRKRVLKELTRFRAAVEAVFEDLAR